jgi:hypothetical protein
MVNVCPLGDKIEHGENTTCPCVPRVEIENGEMIVVHNAADARELLEQAGLPTGQQWGLFADEPQPGDIDGDNENQEDDEAIPV